MIEEKLRARQQRQHPLPRLSCEHVVEGYSIAAQIIRDGVMLSVCKQCWTRQDLLKVTMDGKLIQSRVSDLGHGKDKCGVCREADSMRRVGIE